MFCYNLQNFSKPKMALLYCDIFQIIGFLFDLGVAFVVTIDDLLPHSGSFQFNFNIWNLILYVISCIAGVVTASISLFGLYSDNHQLLIPSIIFCISMSSVTVLNLLYAFLGHVDTLMKYSTVAKSFIIILGIVVGIAAFYESKAINKRRIATQSFAQPRELLNQSTV